MTITPKVIDIDCSTGISVERDMTEQEITSMAQTTAIALAAEAERAVAEEALATLRASARAKLIAGEPLTAEEASIIVI